MRYALIGLILLAASSQTQAAEFHVSPDGADANAGTAAAPFATLTHARDAVRAVKPGAGLPTGGLTVWLHKGTYPLTESFKLTAEDSGVAGKLIIYRAVAGEEVRLVGGRTIPAEAFKPAADTAIMDRLDPAARPHVLCANLKELGITNYGEFPDNFENAPPIMELFFDDQRMSLARWPNDEWATIAKVIESGPASWRNHDSDKPGTFAYDGDRPSRWLKAPAVWVHGYWCFDWASETKKVKTIDTEKKEITFTTPHHYGIGSGNPAARRFYAVNLLEELDQPGEYYIDRAAGMLYFSPPKLIGEGRAVVSTLADPVIKIEGASFITLQGLTVETCVANGIEVTGGQGVRIAACRVRNTGQNGVVVKDGAKHTVVACDIYDTGMGGVLISGGDRKTLTPSGHEVLNNHIYRVSRRQRTHAYQLQIGGVGVHVAHNLLHDAPHQAIGLGGNDHIIEYNDIHHTGMETDDCGAFYMGRNPSERGTIIRYNFWHDIGSALSHGSCAIYFDDGAGGQTVFGNVFYKAAGGSFGAVFNHGGHDNIAENNVFVECKKAIGAAPWDDKRWKDYVNAPLWQQVLLKDVDITKPPYIERYPDLKGFMEPNGQPRKNHAMRNVAYKCAAFLDGNWEDTDNFVTNDDPGFEDAAHLDFRLKKESVVFQKVPGFKDIPFGQIGLQRDELRPALSEAGR
ncbi:MAG: right-handed parallel beta-helix repeat-containing protein [Candidatus Hydrogenedentes bacterium]|nr:right-handed parallel beta-helix repeat-containing protein [Candidatus Hydrogenedentota bacterium]